MIEISRSNNVAALPGLDELALEKAVHPAELTHFEAGVADLFVGSSKQFALAGCMVASISTQPF